MKSHLFKIILIMTILPALCQAGDFDKLDKELFASVCVLQIADGLTTMGHLSNSEHNYISDGWNWKYGTSRPSPELMWGVKAIELVGAYYVGKKLNKKWRRRFFYIIDATLIYCVAGNIEVGAGFKFKF